MIKTSIHKALSFFTKKYFRENKKKMIFFYLLLIIIIFTSYKTIFNNDSITTYNIGQIKKSDIITSISTTGQVGATSQIDIKSKNSGPIIKINMITGQEVKSGTILAEVENKDSWYAYRSAQISYQKLTKEADSISKIQAENTLDQAKNNLEASYVEAKVNIDNVFVDLPNMINGMNDMYYTSSGILNSVTEVSLPSVARSYKTEAGINFDKAKKDFENNLSIYKSYNTNSSKDDIKKLIDLTYNNIDLMIKSVRGTKNTLNYLQNSNNNTTNLSTAQNTVNGWLNQLNSHLTKLVNAKSNINISEKTILEKENSLTDVLAGADVLDIESARLSLNQKRDAYNDSFIKAPFDGIIAKVDIKKGDEISSNTSIATIISKQKIISVDLNEVDIAKVKIGQLANITFDAIDDLNATGTVVSVDWVGTVSQGVVSYNVQIVMNTEDIRIMSGMTANVNIETDNKKDIYVLDNNAIKTQNNTSYVELIKDDNVIIGDNIVLDKTKITRKKISIGISDDDNTEIISGLEEGDKIIIKTNNKNSNSTKSTNQSAPSLFGNTGGNMRSGGVR